MGVGTHQLLAKVKNVTCPLDGVLWERHLDKELLDWVGLLSLTLSPNLLAWNNVVSDFIRLKYLILTCVVLIK